MTSTDHQKPLPVQIDQVDLWGPPSIQQTQGVTLRAPRKRKPWGGLFGLWGFLAIIGSQVVALPILAVLAISQGGLSADDPMFAIKLTEAITETLTGSGAVVALLAQWAAFVGVPLWATYRKGHRSLAKDFGLWFKWRDLPLGFALAAALQILLMGIGWLLEQTSLDLSSADNTNQVTDHTGALLIIMVFAASVGAPLTEELFFRGMVLRAFLRSFAKVDHAPLLPGLTDEYHHTAVSDRRRKVGTVAAVLLSSAFFGVLHLQGGEVGHWIVGAQTGLLGLVFAIVALKTRRIGLTIVAHLFFNSASLTLVFLS